MFKNIVNTLKYLLVVSVVISAASFIISSGNLKKAIFLLILTIIASLSTVALSIKSRRPQIPSYDIKIFENGKRTYNTYKLDYTKICFFMSVKTLIALYITYNNETTFVDNLVNVGLYISIAILLTIHNKNALMETYVSYKKPQEIKVLSEKLKEILIPQSLFQKNIVKQFKEYK